MKNLSKNSKIVIALGLLGLSYYLWKQQQNKENIESLKDGANKCADCEKK